MKISFSYCILFFSFIFSSFIFAEPVKINDTAENLKILPPWTMRICPTDFYATYDLEGAKQLKKIDSACALAQMQTTFYKAQITDLKSVVTDFKAVLELQKQERLLDQGRIDDLMTQLKKEIEEKNTYKYKPTYNWIWAVIGGGAALVVTGMAVGFGVAYAKK
jgi:hypothetical protein